MGLAPNQAFAADREDHAPAETRRYAFYMNMKFNIYNRFVLEIIRKEKRWIAFRIGEGVKVPESNLIIPQDLEESELIYFIEDIYHEFAQPGKSIENLE
jgi:hypothetical protein